MTKNPRRFYNVRTVSGLPAGFGFACEVCRNVVPHSIGIGQGVEHCGGVEHAPGDGRGLETKRLGGRHYDSRFVMTTDLEDDGVPNSNTEVFENERRGTWI
jgi:hypothetical protein